MKKRSLIISIVSICIIALVTYLFLNKNKNDAPINEITLLSDYDIIIGEFNASNTLILYFDYNCKYCKKFFENVYPEIKKQFIDGGILKIVLRPVCKSNDITATNAYQTLLCINKFGNFDKLHQLLLHEPRIIYTEQYQQLTDEFINTNANVAECILNTNNEAILKNIYEFQELKTKGTPTFVLNNKVIVGYKDFQFFEDRIKKNH
ncbi:DsbA family protein [Carboxylicivirga caseinilyticus]|uniref:DsbA family protein n=1 Tax=Carboxylicivirga caseinilyticus TaxID=3417572 RepID=UPI003D33DD5C|nr:DsbA family protein [Marinilabiliaceae bacterium A049]